MEPAVSSKSGSDGTLDDLSLTYCTIQVHLNHADCPLEVIFFLHSVYVTRLELDAMLLIHRIRAEG